MRTAAVITARLGSTRLPGKMLLDLAGRPVIDHVVERVRRATRPDTVVLATTAEAGDDALARRGAELGVEVFRGPTEDVLARWLGVAERYDADLLVCCDGDDVLCDPTAMDAVVRRYVQTGADYITYVGLPFGTAPTGVARRGLADVCARKRESNTEGQGRFFADPALRRVELEAPAELRHDAARLTLDYPEDLELLEALIAALGDGPELGRVVDLLRQRPDLVAINSGRQEEYWRRFRAAYPAVELAAE